MCFSPEASFTSAAILAVVGVATINLAKQHKELLMLAFMPFLFAIQQAGEGLVWLGLKDIIASPLLQDLGKNVFILFAYAVWPIYVPLALYFTEKNPALKKAMLTIAFLGAAVVATIFYNISLSEITPKVAGYSIRYISEPPVLYKIGYLAAVVVPFFLSSLQWTSLFAVLISAAFAVTDYVYFVDFTSIWCFYGAVFSIALYWVIKKAVQTKSFSKTIDF